MHVCEFDASHLTWVFHETLSGSRDNVADAVERIMSIIQEMPCAREHLDDVRLALTEALANAVVHGNKEDPSKKVEVSGACEAQEKLILVVTDEGEGFDPSSIPDPTVADNIYSAHGRGIFLINRTMCHAEYRLGGRQVILRKKVSGGRATV